MMTSVIDKYYRKISENIDKLKIKFDSSSLLVKTKELDNKIESTYNKSDINSKMDLIHSKKDTDDILNNIDSKFYSKTYLDNELNNYYYKSNIDNKISNLYDNYYDKNHLNLQFNNLYDRNHLDNKFDDIYTKTDVNDINSKLNRNINIFNTNLINNINSYKNNKKDIDNNIKNNKAKLDKMRYYIKETFMHNIDLICKFIITGEQDFIQILQFEVDRVFLIDDMIKFFLSIKIVYLNMKTNYWTLFLRIDVLYKNEELIKSFSRYMLSKGFLFKNLAHFDINIIFKLNQNTDRLIFKIYMEKVNESYKDDITITLTNEFENNYCNIEHLTIV